MARRPLLKPAEPQGIAPRPGGLRRDERPASRGGAAALRRRWDLLEYLGEAILRAFRDMPGRTGGYLIWALLEAPTYLPADRAIPYELQLQVYDIAAWLITQAGREWMEQLPPPVKQVQLSFLTA